MALVKKRTSSNRVIIIAIVVLALGGIGWYLVQLLLVPGGGAPTGNLNQSQSVITNFGEEILNDVRYRELQPYGQTPNINVNQAGNPNPFQ